MGTRQNIAAILQGIASSGFGPQRPTAPEPVSVGVSGLMPENYKFVAQALQAQAGQKAAFELEMLKFDEAQKANAIRNALAAQKAELDAKKFGLDTRKTEHGMGIADQKVSQSDRRLGQQSRRLDQYDQMFDHRVDIDSEKLALSQEEHARKVQADILRNALGLKNAGLRGQELSLSQDKFSHEKERGKASDYQIVNVMGKASSPTERDYAHVSPGIPAVSAPRMEDSPMVTRVNKITGEQYPIGRVASTAKKHEPLSGDKAIAVASDAVGEIQKVLELDGSLSPEDKKRLVRYQAKLVKAFELGEGYQAADEIYSEIMEDAEFLGAEAQATEADGDNKHGLVGLLLNRLTKNPQFDPSTGALR